MNDTAPIIQAPWYDAPCRFLTLVTFMLWFGGFTFYTAVVIPTAHQVLGTHLEVGFITQQVTNWINASGVLAILTLAANLWLLKRNGVVHLRPLATTLCVLAATQVALIVFHPHLDGFLTVADHEITHRAEFYVWHRTYLILATIQWCAGVVYLWLVLSKWHVMPHSRHQ